jgi:hypothetical protein
MSDYSWIQRKASFPLSDMLLTVGATGWMISSLLYFGVVEATLQVPTTYSLGFAASFALMAVSFAVSVWTAGAKSLTFFGWLEWLATLIMVVWLFLPLAFADLWASYSTVNPIFGVVVSTIFWTLAVRDNR